MKSEVFSGRIRGFGDLLASNEIDFGVWSNKELIVHLTGLTTVEGFIVYHLGEVSFLTDRRFEQEVERIKSVININIFTDSIFSYLGRYKIQSGRMALDFTKVTHLQYKTFSRTFPDAVIIDVSEIIPQEINKADEYFLENFAKGSKITEELFRISRDIFYSNREISEKQLKWKLSEYLLSTEAVGFSFEPIIAVNANSAKPHHHPGNENLKDADILLVDLGVNFGGVCTDVTRTFCKPDFDKGKNTEAIVKTGFNDIYKSITDGIPVKKLTEGWLNALKHISLEKNFTHALGHGLGYQVHQEPRISQFSDEIISKDRIIAIEPALYFPGEFGYRFECDILVSDKGCTNMTDFYV